MLDVLAFGEVLWDVIDGVPHLGGAPFNLAAHAAKCGLRAAIVSAVGRDDLGRRAVAEARRLGVLTDFIAEHPTLPTGTVNVTLDTRGVPSYEIVKPVAWDEIDCGGDAQPRVASVCLRAFCFGTLAQRSPVSAATLAQLLAALPDSTLVFFDVNLRQHFWSRELVERGLARTDILKVNDEEMRALGFAPDALFARFPRLSTIVETRGAAGCVVTPRAGAPLASPALPDGPVVDTVGAGDAFSAAFLAAVLRGESLQSAAEAGNRLAGRVAARPGAIPRDL